MIYSPVQQETLVTSKWSFWENSIFTLFSLTCHNKQQSLFKCEFLHSLKYAFRLLSRERKRERETNVIRCCIFTSVFYLYSILLVCQQIKWNQNKWEGKAESKDNSKSKHMLLQWDPSPTVGKCIFIDYKCQSWFTRRFFIQIL